ncbi:permease for cytosine/purines, uracil, thiamine, allantoin-domain-containing protein [Mycena crocata]|nr:permease for cytosine/purines, uracil, thiamine, allantoin-domain-containing protein [Mycena crocata]
MTPTLEQGDGPTRFQRLTNFLRRWGVETNGIAPIPEEQRVDARIYQLFFVWFSANMNITGLVVGAGGPVVFKLSLRDCVINLVITNHMHHSRLFACSFFLLKNDRDTHPIHSAVFGPKLGMRAMVHARYSWGLHSVKIPSILNVLSSLIFLVINAVIAGQMLATLSDHLTPTIGIIIISLVSLVISFCGYKIIHWFETVAWIPTVISLCVMLGVGGLYLTPGPSYPKPTASMHMSFAAPNVANVVSWCTGSADYGVYHDAHASSARIFTYTYLGLGVPLVVLSVVGAVFGAAVSSVPSWNAGYDNGNNLGGLLSAILEPCGWFGSLLIVLMALAVSAPNVLIIYSCGISLMNVSSVFATVPRYLYAIIATAICIPIAVFGQTRFYAYLVTVVDLIGYFSAPYAGIILTEHLVFRRNDFARYEVEDWYNRTKLPPGLAALFSFFGSFFLIVPCMEQSWYVGPIAKAGTGDIGILVGFFGACGLYGTFRPLEIRLFPSHSS